MPQRRYTKIFHKGRNFEKFFLYTFILQFFFLSKVVFHMSERVFGIGFILTIGFSATVILDAQNLIKIFNFSYFTAIFFTL